jgi:hypothetical protein
LGKSFFGKALTVLYHLALLQHAWWVASVAGFVACRLACNGLAWLQVFLALRLFAGSHVLKGVSTVISQSALPPVGLVSANSTHPAFGWL